MQNLYYPLKLLLGCILSLSLWSLTLQKALAQVPHNTCAAAFANPVDLSTTDFLEPSPFTINNATDRCFIWGSYFLYYQEAYKEMGGRCLMLPITGSYSIQYTSTNPLPAPDAVLTVYRGTCGTLSQIACVNSLTGRGY